MDKNKAIFDQVLPPLQGKSDVKKRQALALAVEIAAKEGLEACTFDRLSKEMGVTRPLLNHYFKTRENLFQLAADFVRASIQSKVLSQIQDEENPVKIIELYVETNFEWHLKDRKHLDFWLQYLSSSTYDRERRTKNTKFVEMGRKRIEEIVKMGIIQKKFHIGSRKPEEVAKTIQLLITGGVVSISTETLNKDQKEELIEMTKRCALNLLGINN